MSLPVPQTTDDLNSPSSPPQARQPSATVALSRSSYLPTLDGWRAVAIVLVLFDHGKTFHLGRFSTEPLQGYGAFGVEIFFAISGLLICSRLLDEETKTGAMQMKAFYIRRFFRIQPPALLYLLAVFALTLFHRLPPFTVGLMAATLLVRNFFGIAHENTATRGWATVHYWSLSVEEHFYLILPAFLRFARRRRATLLLGLALAGYIWRSLQGLRFSPDRFAQMVRTDNCLCFLFLSAGIAVLLQRQTYRQFAFRYIRIWSTLPIAILLLLIHSRVHVLAEIMPIFMLLGTVLHPGEIFSRLLESAPFKFIGRISYSLYLWQELFLTSNWAPTIRPFGWINASLLAWPCVFAAAIASYYLVEKPFIRLGHRLAPPATKGRPI